MPNGVKRLSMLTFSKDTLEETIYKLIVAYEDKTGYYAYHNDLINKNLYDYIVEKYTDLEDEENA